MSDIVVTERGWAGHFICSDRCSFRRNTLIEYKDKKIIVSTVGVMRNSITSMIDTIGHERWYETMAFEGINCEGYIDADVLHEVNLGDCEWGMFASTWEELVEKYPTPDNYANNMHENAVQYIIENIKEIKL